MAASDDMLTMLAQLNQLVHAIEARNRARDELEQEFLKDVQRLRDLETARRGKCELCQILLDSRNKLQQSNVELIEKLRASEMRVAAYEALRK